MARQQRGYTSSPRYMLDWQGGGLGSRAATPRLTTSTTPTSNILGAASLGSSNRYQEAAAFLMDTPPPKRSGSAASSNGSYLPADRDRGAMSTPKGAGDVTLNVGSPAPKDKESKAGDSDGEIFYVVGLPVSTWSTSFQFLFLMGMIFFFFLIYGYCQELIFSFEEFKSYGWYLTLTQFGFYTVFGLLATQVQTDTRRRIPLKTYVLLSLLTVTTMGMSNASLGYLNYPTQVIFKCCKLIPVMIGGILIQGKPYGIVDAGAAICMSIGLIFFTLADSTISPKFDTTGVLLISTALGADAIIGNVQEKAMRAHRASSAEVVLYSYSIGFFILLFGILLHGSFLEAFWFCYQHPVETYVYAFLFSCSGYAGIIFVLAMIRQFGALLTVTVTTTRKTVTMILSFLLFPKPFTIQYVWSGLLVIFGIFLNLYSKNKTSFNHWLADKVRRLVIRLQHRHHGRYASTTAEV